MLKCGNSILRKFVSNKTSVMFLSHAQTFHTTIHPAKISKKITILSKSLMPQSISLKSPILNSVLPKSPLPKCLLHVKLLFQHNCSQFVTTLPRTHYLGVDVSKGLTISHMASHPQDAQYPDARYFLCLLHPHSTPNLSTARCPMTSRMPESQ